MDKRILSVIKLIEKSTRKVEADALKYCKVQNTILFVSDLETTVTIINSGIPDGVYRLSDLCKGVVIDRGDMPVSELPNYIGKYDSPYLFTLPISTNMKSMAKFASKDVGILSGVYLNDSGCISTNSHWGKYTTTQLQEDSVVLSQLACNVLEAIGGFTKLQVHGRVLDGKDLSEPEYVQGSCGNFTVFTTPLAGRFPNFPACIPTDLKHQFTITPAHRKLLTTTQKMGYKSIRFVGGDIFASKSLDMENSDRVVADGVSWPDDVVCCFSLKYLTDLLNDTGKGDIVVDYVSEKLPYVFNSTYLLMPLRGTGFTDTGCVVNLF